MTCGAIDIDSIPPTSAVRASSSRIMCAPETMDWMPLPQRRLTVSAGRSAGTPALSATWRAP